VVSITQYNDGGKINCVMSHGKKSQKGRNYLLQFCPVKRITAVMGYKQLTCGCCQRISECCQRISGCCQLISGCCQRINGCCQLISGCCQRINGCCQRIGVGRQQMLLLLMLICWLAVVYKVYFLYTVLSVHSVRPNQKASPFVFLF
jgi:hypothetical protein